MATIIKQYTYKEAYSGNTEVFLYENGKLMSSTIMNDYDLSGYFRRLTDEGYTLCYSPEEIEEYKKEFERAKELYEMALKSPLYKSNS